MPGPSPLNSACRCCSEPPNASVSLEYVSVEQACNTTSCGELPCTSTEAVYDEDENCISPATTCSPNWADLTRAEKCAAVRYLTITEVDRTGGGNHGRTQVRQYTTDEEGNCDLETTCSGTHRVTTVTTGRQDETFDNCGEGDDDASFRGSYGGSYRYTTVETTTFAEECTSSSELNSCTGNSSYYSTRTSCNGAETVSYNCSSQISDSSTSDPLLCQWIGTESGTEYEEPEPIYEPCFVGSEINITHSPQITCKITTTYTEANEQGFCTPKTLPSFPAFTQCTPEGEEPPEPPALLEGQGSDSTAYNYKNPYNPLITSKQNIKYRVAHSHSGTCYLKVWFRNKVQKYKYEDCDSGFAGDPPRTAAITIDCNPPAPAYQCYNRWSTAGEPTFVETGTYTWNGSGYPCLADEEKWQGACENIIYSSGSGVKTVTPEENTSVTVEYKYSLIKNYEPDWGDENGCQGCKPNGYPIPNPDDCPVCTP